jgi:hypothetical protein
MQYRLLAFTNAKPGEDEAFNDWYTNVHLADVLKLPGVTSAQRFRISDTQLRPGSSPFEYMAIYEIDIDNIEVTLSALRSASGTPEMPLSPAMQDKRMVWIYEPITPPVTAG